MVRDSVLALTVVSGPDSQEAQFHLDRSFVLPSLLPLRLAFGGDLKKGSTYNVRVFDPAMLTLRDVSVRVAAETTLASPDSAAYDSTAMAWTPVHLDTVRAFRVEASSEGEPMRLWIDGEGRIVREEYPQGVTLSRTSYELAAENFRHRDTARIARASADPPAGALVPVTAAAAGVAFGAPLATLRVRFSGAPASAFALAGDGQTVAGDTVVIRRAVPESLTPGFHLPFRDTSFSTALRAEPLVPAGDARIMFPLMRIIQLERDPVKVAALLTHWVAARVRPSGDVPIPSALIAITSGKGDANAATALYLALARSSGLPARAAAGVVYLRGRFYYHAWPEVWLGRWVPVDPVADQFPADAAHLRLAVGTLARRAELVRRLGTLKLEAP
jgi:transglutaminase-like putative cysteine protease